MGFRFRKRNALGPSWVAEPRAIPCVAPEYAGRDSNPYLLVYKTKALKAFARLPLSYRRMR